MAEVIELRVSQEEVIKFCEARWNGYVHNDQVLLPRLKRSAIYHFTMRMGIQYEMIPDEDQNNIDEDIKRSVDEWYKIYQN